MAKFVAGACLLAAAAAQPPPDDVYPGLCVEPAVCTPPNSKYSNVLPVQSRQQWTNKDGYCGALSVQASAMAFGMWISEDQVRRAAGGEDVPGGGLEIYYRNIVPAFRTLKLTHEDWDYQGEPQPQYKNYFKWLKRQLVAGHPVTWMILTKHDHASLGAGAFSHIEPVWGIFSNHSLDDDTVYDDDVVVHGADYWANATVEGPSLYRRFDSLDDDESMAGNCAKAIGTWGHNEFYPCVMHDVAYGFALTGYEETSGSSLPLVLSVDRFDEPEYPWTASTPAAQLRGTVTVQGPLEIGASYKILRWDDFRNVPTDGSYLSSSYDYSYDFVAQASTHVFQDPKTFASSGTTYYRCIAAPVIPSMV
jgi:hypothetical protein